MNFLGKQKSLFLIKFWHLPQEDFLTSIFSLSSIQEREWQHIFHLSKLNLIPLKIFLAFLFFCGIFFPPHSCISQFFLISCNICAPPFPSTFASFTSGQSNLIIGKIESVLVLISIKIGVILVSSLFFPVTNITIQSFCHFIYPYKLKSHYNHAHKTI